MMVQIEVAIGNHPNRRTPTKVEMQATIDAMERSATKVSAHDSDLIINAVSIMRGIQQWLPGDCP